MNALRLFCKHNGFITITVFRNSFSTNNYSYLATVIVSFSLRSMSSSPVTLFSLKSALKNDSTGFSLDFSYSKDPCYPNAFLDDSIYDIVNVDTVLELLKKIPENSSQKMVVDLIINESGSIDRFDVISESLSVRRNIAKVISCLIIDPIEAMNPPVDDVKPSITTPLFVTR